MKKTTDEDGKELSFAAASLDKIAGNMERWIKQEKGKFKNNAAFRKRWISEWFSGRAIMTLLKDTFHQSDINDILGMLSSYIPEAAESLKKTLNSFLNSVKHMEHIEKEKDSIEARHDLGFWCMNFIDTTVLPTAERFRNVAKQIRNYSATPKQTEKTAKRPKGVLNKQVGELLKSCPPDISASETAKILNKNFAGKYEPTNATSIGKTENWKKHLNKKKPRKKK